MNKWPLVSVVIPTHSRAKLITERAIPSVLDQTYQNFEIIVVLDDCVDNTKDEVLSIGDNRIKIIDFKKDKEYPANKDLRWYVAGVPPRNKGLSNVSGDLIAPLDDDDCFLANHLEISVKKHLETNCDVTYALAETVNRKSGKPNGIIGSRQGSKRMIVPHGSIVYNSKHRNYLYCESENGPADHAFWTKMLNDGLRFEFIDIVTTRKWSDQAHPPPPTWYVRGGKP